MEDTCSLQNTRFSTTDTPWSMSIFIVRERIRSRCSAQPRISFVLWILCVVIPSPFSWLGCHRERTSPIPALIDSSDHVQSCWTR